MIAVAESARNVACTGARPVAITNCLNFGNPYKPGVYWQFKEAVAGVGEACRFFGTPVTGGNVSFYNESPTASVYPTPVIGMLGVIDDIRKACSASFKESGDRIVLLGSGRGHLGGSEYLALVHGLVRGDAPEVDLDTERRLQELCVELIDRELIHSAHDCAEGGLGVALAECCIINRTKPLGCRSVLTENALRPDGALFGEDQARVVISVPEKELKEVLETASRHRIRATAIGTVGGEQDDHRGGSRRAGR